MGIRSGCLNVDFTTTPQTQIENGTGCTDVLGNSAYNSRSFWIGDGRASMRGIGHLTDGKRKDELNNPEIILSLWYIGDELGMIHSLRARAYIGTGSDEEKLAFLRSRAPIDYLVARPFPIAERFHTTLVDGTEKRSSPWLPSHR